MGDRGRRIAITLGALFAIEALRHVPLPGVDMAGFWSPDNGGLLGHINEFGAVKRLSIGALGAMPLLGAFMLIEVWRTILGNPLPDETVWLRRFEWRRLAVPLALVTGAFQAYGIAVALQGMHGFNGRFSVPLVIQPGPVFVVSSVFSMVAALALTAWLAAVITRYGLGSGLWVVTGAAAVGLIGRSFGIVAQLVQQEQVPAVLPFQFAVFLVAAIAVMALCWRASSPSRASLGVDPWPPIMAAAATPYVYHWVVSAFHGRDTYAVAYFNAEPLRAYRLWTSIFAGSVIVIAVLRSVRFHREEQPATSLANALAPALAAGGIVVAAGYVFAGTVILLKADQLIPLVAAALAVHGALRKPSGTPDP